MKSIVGLFDSYQDADRAVGMLIDRGFDRKQISVLAREQILREHLAGRSSAVAEDAGAGVISGATVGGILGALVGMGTLIIPGVGAVLAVGTLAAAIGSAAAGAGVGAITGGLIGALVGMGFSQEDVHFYTEGMRRGGVLVTLRTSEDHVLEALDIMRQANMVDVETRRDEWRREGWKEGAPIADAAPATEPHEELGEPHAESAPAQEETPAIERERAASG